MRSICNGSSAVANPFSRVYHYLRFQLVRLQEKSKPALIFFMKNSGLMAPVFSDWEVNRENFFARVLLVHFRLTQFLLARLRPLGLVLWLSYKVHSEIIMHVELSPRTRVGERLHLPHPQSVVINSNTIIGNDCIIRNGVTIGNKGPNDLKCPVIGDGVQVGANSVLIGGIKVGARAVVGAGSVLVGDVAEGAVVAGNPARPLAW